MMRKHVLTGGPHSGKSSLIELLRGRGYQVLSETAVLIIDELIRTMGIAEARSWRAANRREFQSMVAQRQVDRELLLEGQSGSWFLDRGTLDGLAFSMAHDHEPPEMLSRPSGTSRYARPVFLLDLVVPFVGREETGRTSDESMARRVESLLEAVYRCAGYEVVRVPLLPISDRVQFILERTGESDDD